MKPIIRTIYYYNLITTRDKGLATIESMNKNEINKLIEAGLWFVEDWNDIFKYLLCLK